MSAPRDGSGVLRTVVAVAGLLVAASGAVPQSTGFRPLRFGDPPSTEDARPFLPEAQHDPSIATPDDLLGWAHGTRLAHPAEILDVLAAWDAASPRMVVEPYGVTYEGRPLVRAIVSSPDHLARLDQVRAGLHRLADPRGLDDAEADRLLEELPAVAWMGYSIHGDELSGADASLAVVHHLVADRGRATQQLLDRLLVVVDPCMNPDGRERIVTMVEQGAGYVPNLDHAAMQRGRWPWGRGNHYLFDLNRDWMIGRHPETRGRWRAARDLPPQLFVDAHEMGSLDTFLFYPQAPPHNPFLPAHLGRWHQVFAADQAAAFDARGWAYYTREWADAWAPFYSDAWGSLGGAVGMLYEQASTSGFALRGPTGRVLTYREAVHHQVVSSLANLDTLARHRRELLADWLEARRRNADPTAPGGERMLAVVPGRHPDRERDLVAALLGQGIEVRPLARETTLGAVVSADGTTASERTVPAGTLTVAAAQPEGARVRSYLAFDVPLDEAALQRERTELEQRGTSLMYDASAWSLPLLLDLDAVWCEALPEAGEPVGDVSGFVPDARGPPVDGAGATGAPTQAGLARPDGLADASVFAWVVDGARDASVRFAARALEAGLVVHFAEKPFATAGRRWSRGSLLVRRADNDAGRLSERVERAAREAGVQAHATASGRSPDEGPDLGGGHFLPLRRPRVAVLSGPPVRPDTFGHLWFHLDHDVGVPVSHLDAAAFGRADLRRYNVLVLPPAGGGLASSLARHAESLSAWVEAGGTLVACGDAAAALTSPELAITGVVRRRDVVDDLAPWHAAARRERAARDVAVDVEAVREGLLASGLGTEPAGTVPAGTGGPGAEAGDATEPAGAPGHEGAVGDGGAGDDTDGTDPDEETGAAEPDTDEPDTDEPDTDEPDTDEPDTDETGADVTGADVAGADETGARDDAGAEDVDPDPARRDAWARRFAPAGAVVRGLVDERAWITAGCGAELPVLVSGSSVYLSRAPVTTPVRLAPEERLPLAGLLWPEARERLADSAWLTVEPRGAGQVVLFAEVPAFRGMFAGGARLFANAVVYGPGLGASGPLDW